MRRSSVACGATGRYGDPSPSIVTPHLGVGQREDAIHDLVGAQNAVANRNRSLGQRVEQHQRRRLVAPDPHARALACVDDISRSEEHTSELQSLMRSSYAVFCLKKKKKHNNRVQAKPSYKKK